VLGTWVINEIVVCVKHIKYIYAQTGTDPKKNFIGPDDIVRLINPLDESAVEEALRIKEKHKESEILVISLGDRWVEEGLRRCLSMGADKAIHLYVENCENLDSWTTAMILAHSIRPWLRPDFLWQRTVDDSAAW
jgi:electron transfer flavoprotein beta subunit